MPSIIIKFVSNARRFVMAEDINRLKIVLVEQKKTSRWLASEFGINPTPVSKWRTNTTQPDHYTLTKIANLLVVNALNIAQSEFEKS